MPDRHPVHALLDQTVVLTQAEFDALPEYSATLPTGTTVGKQWKRREPYRANDVAWFRGEYVPSDDEGYVGIEWKAIVLSKM